jgi:CHAT domain-containing protein
MKAFYRARLAGRSKAAALQEAQLFLLHASPYAHPYHWAPFVLMGNWL